LFGSILSSKKMQFLFIGILFFHLSQSIWPVTTCFKWRFKWEASPHLSSIFFFLFPFCFSFVCSCSDSEANSNMSESNKTLSVFQHFSMSVQRRPLKWLLAVVSYLQCSIFRRHKKRRKTNVEKKDWIIQIKIRIHFVKKKTKRQTN
jgi:hypothetical protein